MSFTLRGRSRNPCSILRNAMLIRIRAHCKKEVSFLQAAAQAGGIFVFAAASFGAVPHLDRPIAII
jgi:hypothetical protein